MERYTIDTTAIISYFIKVFEGAESQISPKSLDIIGRAFNDPDIILYFPSIVFIEIFSKWFRDEEFAQKIKSEVFYPIRSQENFAIEPLDKEVLENFMKITDIEQGWNFDNHDKQVLATAMKYQAPLITSDKKIIRYNKRKHVIPNIFS
ncbi:MAG: PIN domain-containing protein [Candidatus Symbiothrix sp.]|jgi:predicted nucleic acid-binding protein|nr:PIN domain-containing protein [Candidatus Symbiothrix sp.]